MKPAREAARKAEMEAKSSSEDMGPIHADNEWEIWYDFPFSLLSLS